MGVAQTASIGVCPSCNYPVAPTQPLAYCLKCGKDLPADLVAALHLAPTPTKDSPTPTREQLAPIKATPALVRVVDVDIRFSSLVGLFVKVVLASIPAMMILAALLFLVIAFLGGLRAYL
jgi:hypothetical protein